MNGFAPKRYSGFPLLEAFSGPLGPGARDVIFVTEVLGPINISLGGL